MIVRRGQTYRNRRMTEVDMHVLEILDLDADSFTLVVYWVRRVGIEILWGPDRVRILRKQLPDWTKLDWKPR